MCHVVVVRRKCDESRRSRLISLLKREGVCVTFVKNKMETILAATVTAEGLNSVVFLSGADLTVPINLRNVLAELVSVALITENRAIGRCVINAFGGNLEKGVRVVFDGRVSHKSRDFYDFTADDDILSALNLPIPANRLTTEEE